MTALYSIDELRAAHAAGHRIQANRGTEGAQRWVDLTNPEFTCPAHLYRIAPAAPAASEGEDGPSYRTCRCNTGFVHQEKDCPAAQAGEREDGAKFGRNGDETTDAADLLRPAAQVAATPKHGEEVEFFVHPEGLNPNTVNLVARFSSALADKLWHSEQKYGYSDGWASSDWMDECRAKLLEHVGKGDPRDVAAYCAFLWHHHERTALATQPAARRVTDDPRLAALIEAAQKALDKAWEYGEDEPHFASLNAALESFAQPAEGVRS